MPTEQQLVDLYTSDEASIANSDSWTQARDYAQNPQAVRDYHFKSRINWILQHGALISKDAAILDVGCATGMLLRTLKDAGYRNLHGVDLSRIHCDYVRESHGIPCDLSLDDIPDRTFDLINCCAVLEHVRDPVEFCRAMAKKLKPGGQIVVGVPNYDADYRRVSGRSWVWLIPPVHLQYFTRRSLETTLTKAGVATTTRDSWYNGTYVYLLAHHVTWAFGVSMPSTRRTGRPATLALINVIEAALRAVVFPWALVARRRLRHNELNFIARMP